ncbi:SRPBCC family protein [Actinoalloteichus hymeniacidonis]|uniref:Activator of Hsp90 ATPase homologue 1/2-like C-terminal domain-containing protein n=1 Tax=Actinoalloteichus hymeniacidonis TaxID=340345 RepID=A0AAC9HQ03_9PSEU|nr:SRPBCC family protein [Actinoalloteichus hymeniacidonis]AOS63507.1 hypothetical protein TL08_13465 [Actinoalloteichus hymeniacidonis]MBB5908449.1 uncharacterized protein YndB with AHSA1/START domain [Actinoalloteichus hymeniacidonis]
MSDIVDQIRNTHREVGTGRIPAGEGYTVLLRRHYDADIDDVWTACTEPDRLARWFLPVSGDLRVGGRYELRGNNTGGEILRCERPTSLTVTWVFGETPTEADVTEVRIRLSAAPEGGTVFELEHTAVIDEERWKQYGPGAAGVGWDISLTSLGRFLAGIPIEDPVAWENSEEAREVSIASSRAWGAAFEASGASAAAAAAATARTTAFYAPEPDQG